MGDRKKLLKSVVIIVSVIVFLTIILLGLKFIFTPKKINQSKIKQYDVIVVGTDPEGIATAVSSARNGLVTLLADNRGRLGGLMTVGGLNSIDMNYNPEDELVTRGIFLEFYNQINFLNFRRTKKDSFDIIKAEKIFGSMVNKEPNLIIKLNLSEIKPLMDGDTIIGVEIVENGSRKPVYAKRVIDATQDADIAAMAGVPFSKGMEDVNIKGEYQVATLIFELDNVDWKKLRISLNTDPHKSTGANNVSAWGFSKEMANYKSSNPNIRMRGLNIGRQKGRKVLINSMHIFGVDPLDKEFKKEALEIARAELPFITQYIKQNVPGFENAVLAGSMEELYIRESRHIYGEYRLSINDVLENVDFKDKIALGSYPVDIQPTSKNNTGYVVGTPMVYSVPFRSIVPLKVENLLVVGRSASYDSLAHGSARVIPIGMVIGQAAGVACKYSINNNQSFRQMTRDDKALGSVQSMLKDQGAYLEDFSYPYPAQGHWALKGIRFLRYKGLIAGGYNNDYNLDSPVSGLRFQNLINETLRRSLGIKKTAYTKKPNDNIDRNDAASMLLWLAGIKVPMDKEPFEIAIKEGLISQQTAKMIKSQPTFDNASAYMMITEFVEYLEKKASK